MEFHSLRYITGSVPHVILENVVCPLLLVFIDQPVRIFS
jgi:hypothetical protein